MVEITCERWRRTRHEGLVVHESLVIDDEDRDDSRRDPVHGGGSARSSISPVRSARSCSTPTSTPPCAASWSHSMNSGRARDSARDEGPARTADGSDAAVDGADPPRRAPRERPERLLADMLVRHGLPAPAHQYVVRDDAGAIRRARRSRLPRREHRHRVRQRSSITPAPRRTYRDAARRNAIVALGFTVLVATAADLRDDATALSRSSVRRHRSLTREVASLDGVMTVR